jgi:ribosome-binding protein aMBF1 (putative translation factor)
MRKCPVCNWEIKDDGIKVKTGGKEVVVCCEECADKLNQKKKTPSKK